MFFRNPFISMHTLESEHVKTCHDRGITLNIPEFSQNLSFCAALAERVTLCPCITNPTHQDWLITAARNLNFFFQLRFIKFRNMGEANKATVERCDFYIFTRNQCSAIAWYIFMSNCDVQHTLTASIKQCYPCSQAGKLFWGSSGSETETTTGIGG